MLLKQLFPIGKKEDLVIDKISGQIKLLCSACESFRDAITNRDLRLMHRIIEMERDGDVLKREIFSTIYAGAFLPYLRPDLFRFVHIVDDVFDLLEDAAFQYLELTIAPQIDFECSRVAELNLRMCEMLGITFEAMLKGEELREKILAVRIYEKKIDDIKFEIIKKIRSVEVKSFWEGTVLHDFISSLTSMSDMIEDASDHLQIISASLR
jgi:predicted phosphate transport protein (TIGR00153 family)